MVTNWAILWGMAAVAQEKVRCRWFRITPGGLLPVLLAIEGFLWLSERFRWFAFTQHKGWTVLIAVGAVGMFLLLMFLWFLAALIFRWRFQFSILSLFVLTVVVALPCGWLKTEMKAAREERDFVIQITTTGGRVVYDYQRDPDGIMSKPHAPTWLRHLLGDDLFVNVVSIGRRRDTSRSLPHRDTSIRAKSRHRSLVNEVWLKHITGLIELQRLDIGDTDVTDAGLENLKGLTSLQRLRLDHTAVTDTGLESLKGLTELQTLNLDGTNVTDAGLEHLKGLTHLQWLDLSNTKVSDAGLEHLKGLTQLRELFLNDTNVSDAGLERLKGLPQLQWLWFNRTKVTDAGVKKLQRALPKCHIFH